MELGIRGRRALVCGASRGLGRGVAEALAAEGVDLVLNARRPDLLAEAAAAIRAAHGVEVVEAPGDITLAADRARVLDLAAAPDILITNAGGPPAGRWQDWAREDLLAALEGNLLTPVALMQACLPAMIDRGWGRVVNITSTSVKGPIPELGLSNMARTGLTGYVAGVARQVAGSGVAVNNLLPGKHDTDRILSLDGRAATEAGVDMAEQRRRSQSAIPAGRYGDPAEFGAAAAFLCSNHAGFIIGQNILLDGGALSATI